jgi:hypothetical protein
VGWRDWQNRRLVVPAVPASDGWRAAGEDRYTCVAPPGYEKDPAVTAAIRSFDPTMIPMWRIQLWYAPREFEPIKVVHHGIGRYYPYPRYVRRPFHVDTPQGWTGEIPNFLDAFFEDPEPNKFIGPPTYIPWDWRTYRFCRQQWILLTVDKYRLRIAAHRERMEADSKKHTEEIEYRKRVFEKTALPMLDKITPQDWLEYMKLQREGRPRRPLVSVPGDGSPPVA